MFKSRVVQLGRLCLCSKHRFVQRHAFHSSCPIREDHQSALKSKLSSMEGDITGEKWFPNLPSPRPSRCMPNEKGDELVKKAQSEEGKVLIEESQNQKDAPVWRKKSAPDPHRVKDISKLFREDGSVTIDPIFLRDSCQCSLCIDRSTLQRKFVTAHIPLDIKPIFQGRSNRGRVKVGWINDIPGYSADHESIYSQEYLRSLTSPPPDSAIARKRHDWDKDTFEDRANWTSYSEFLNDTEAYRTAMSALHRDGLIFITKVDSNEGAVARMAKRIGPIRNTFYGSVWDVRSVADSRNVAYTNQHLGFHMDLLYMTNPPGYQLLHCLKNSCSGGESRFADAFFAATRLRRVNEKAYRLLCRYPVEWTYKNDGQFYLQRRPTFQEVFHFIGSEENGKRRLQRKENKDSDADLAYVNWSPPFHGKLYHNLELPERTTAFVEAIRQFDRILNSDEMVVELKMEEGTCAIFENRRIVHARNAFKMEEGERWLRGAYVDEDAFWSACHALGADKYDTSSIAQPQEPVVRKYELPTGGQ